MVRFRCPECSRGLRVPEAVIGRRLACPFCQSLFQSSFEEPAIDPISVVPTDNPKTDNVLTRWVPSKTGIMAAASKATDSARSAVQSVSNVAVNGASAAAEAVSSTAKRAAAGLTPFAQVATGFASVVLPGVGEVMSGKTAQGFATLAAFIGTTAVATTATGGAWVAVPIAIRVFSAVSASQSGKKLGEKLRDSIMESNADELQAAAAALREEAAAMEQADFEQLMLEREAEELKSLEAEPPKRKIVLLKIVN